MLQGSRAVENTKFSLANRHCRRQLLHKLKEEKRALTIELEKMRREHAKAAEDIEEMRKRKHHDVEEVRTLFLQKQQLVKEVSMLHIMLHTHTQYSIAYVQSLLTVCNTDQKF